jgi:hypothetical protein
MRLNLTGALLSAAWLAQPAGAPVTPPVLTTPVGSAVIEQVAPGEDGAPDLVERFDGLGAGFTGPHGTTDARNPSDNSLAVGPDHIVQIVNARMAIYTKKGKRFDTTARVLYGPVVTNTLFKGFGGACEERVSGDAVVRYDQLAGRWLFVLPVFQRGPVRPGQAAPQGPAAPAQVSRPGRPDQPGPAVPLYVPPRADPSAAAAPPGTRNPPPDTAPVPGAQGPYSMCYAISTGSDPLGAYYRYEFLRPLFPDYPRPAIWPDGYYVPTSVSDDRISASIVTRKQACVVDRARMLAGASATEQCLVIDNVNFLNTADLDGTALPPRGAPNIMIAAGGTQLDGILEDDRIFAWRFHVDWAEPARTSISGPQQIRVAPYRYLCGGQLTKCVPQPGTDRRLDAQGDKIMARLVYRKVNGRESIVAVHSVNTSAGGGGVRWYELRVGRNRELTLYQQGTYAPDGLFRWMASPAIDRHGNIGIGYSYGGSAAFVGQRFAGRLAGDPRGLLTRREAVLVEGEHSQDATRWEDYTQTAIDPSDDCTIWYVGDYVKKGAPAYSTKIGAFRLPGCEGAR